MEVPKRIRYRRRFSYHPVPSFEKGLHANVLLRRTKLYPYRAGWEFFLVGARAIQVLTEWNRRTGKSDRLYGELLSEFFSLRRRVWQALPDDPAAFETDDEYGRDLEYVWYSDPWADLDEHLHTLSRLWLDETRPIPLDDPMSLGIAKEDRAGTLARNYAIAAMRYLELAILAAASHSGDRSMQFAMKASHVIDRAVNLTFDAESEAIRKLARRGGKARQKVDPKQRAKVDVYAMWLEWQNNNKAMYETKSKFALAAVKKHEFVLESTQTVERWQRRWEDGKDIPDGG
ncbi:hypothetical protein [Burkholderia pseudomallei]|uniref:hypothetical protein n=1 Tax=Burkholderia pseudomallei TaxID=28450 RepID=UPI001AD75EAF|nr:hypothetical protein [Burkholderia pseudomallei]MBO7754497.1 hypothetical protein [Burkholderia pseudomallei]